MTLRPHLIVALLSMTATAAVSDTRDARHWHNMAGRGANLWSVAYGDGVFMAANAPRVLLTSRDGYTWSSVTVNVSEADWNKVVYVNGRFFLLGPNPAFSVDGVQWVGYTWPEQNLWPEDLAWGDGSYVALGVNGTVLTSLDGLTWQQVSTPISEKSLEAVTFANGRFVCVGFRIDLQRGIILTSLDGYQWTQASLPAVDLLMDVTYGDGKFVAVGYPDWVEEPPAILVSEDGSSWRKANSISYGILFGVTYGEGRFVAAGDQIFSSENGRDWEIDDISTLPSAYTYHDEVNFPDVPLLTWLEGGVSYGNGLFVAVGRNGAVFQPASLSPPPTMSVAHSGQRVTLSWPADSTGYVPEWATTVESPFAEFSGVPVQQGDQLQLDVDTTGPQKFFRLRRP